MFRRKKSVITVTFDPYHNLPMMKAKNCSVEQIMDAALFMQGHAKIDKQKIHHGTSNRRRKKESRIHKFFRILKAIIFDKKDGSSFEESRKAYNCHHSFYPYYPDERVVPAALPTKV